MTREQLQRLNELQAMEWDGTLAYLNDYSLFVELEQLERLADEQEQQDAAQRRNFYAVNGFSDALAI